MAVSTEALSSFEEKWSLAHPELPLSLRFVQPQARPLVSALACLTFEVGLAAFNVAEASVAASKLHWWAEELALLSSGKVRHPLTQALAESRALKALPSASWQAWIGAAFAQREAVPARSLTELLAGYRSFYDPQSLIESAIYPALSVHAASQARALSRVVQETIRLPESLSAERLPLPLDLLARHELSRGELGKAGPQRDALLREHFSSLAEAMNSMDRGGLAPMSAARLAADQSRCRRTSGAANPLETSASNLDRLPFSALWACWRAARRVQPSS